MEQLIFYTLIFIIGTLFGSFFTLAVYRIPLHQDITHKRSYCPNCNHRLSFWDMIPILSYIFLGGKCRYCGKKIRIRYLCLEILTGMIFLLFSMSLNIKLIDFQFTKIIFLIIGMLHLAGIIIIAGIDKENKNIEISVITYESIVMLIYMIYLYVVDKTNIYRYVIYLILLMFIIIFDFINIKKNKRNSYPFRIIELSLILSIFGGEIVYYLSAIYTLLFVGFKTLIDILNKQKKGKKSFGTYLICANIFLLILTNWLLCR